MQFVQVMQFFQWVCGFPVSRIMRAQRALQSWVWLWSWHVLAWSLRVKVHLWQLGPHLDTFGLHISYAMSGGMLCVFQSRALVLVICCILELKYAICCILELKCVICTFICSCMVFIDFSLVLIDRPPVLFIAFSYRFLNLSMSCHRLFRVFVFFQLLLTPLSMVFLMCPCFFPPMMFNMFPCVSKLLHGCL